MLDEHECAERHRDGNPPGHLRVDRLYELGVADDGHEMRGDPADVPGEQVAQAPDQRSSLLVGERHPLDMREGRHHAPGLAHVVHGQVRDGYQVDRLDRNEAALLGRQDDRADTGRCQQEGYADGRPGVAVNELLRRVEQAIRADDMRKVDDHRPDHDPLEQRVRHPAWLGECKWKEQDDRESTDAEGVEPGCQDGCAQGHFYDDRTSPRECRPVAGRLKQGDRPVDETGTVDGVGLPSWSLAFRDRGRF